MGGINSNSNSNSFLFVAVRAIRGCRLCGFSSLRLFFSASPRLCGEKSLRENKKSRDILEGRRDGISLLRVFLRAIATSRTYLNLVVAERFRLCVRM